MLKLLILGALGYAGYTYYRNNAGERSRLKPSPRQTAVAGGPLSKDARLQHTPAPPRREG